MSSDDETARCGHSDVHYEDDPPDFEYEIVECRVCGAAWAFAYDPEVGNVEVPL